MRSSGASKRTTNSRYAGSMPLVPKNTASSSSSSASGGNGFSRVNPLTQRGGMFLMREYHNISKGHKSDDQTSTRASERPIWNERYAPSSPVKYEIWRPLEWPELPPDGNECDNVPRKSDAESVAPSPDKGRERQHQSCTFQLATKPTECWEEPPTPKLPNSAPPIRSSADRPYYPPHPQSFHHPTSRTTPSLP